MVGTVNIETIGHLGGSIRKTIGPIRRAITALKIKPAMRINNVEYFSEEDCERVRDYLIEGKGKVEK